MEPPFLKIVQSGHPVLRQSARALSRDEILAPETQRLIERMRETMRDAPGVGLAAPQVGLGIALIVVEDRAQSMQALPEQELARRERTDLSFRVLCNPVLTVTDATPVEFFEGCLSVSGFVALVPRARAVRVEALDERAEPVTLEARGWPARILQHECDHLAGTLCIDRMYPRTFMLAENYSRHWRELSVEEIVERLGLARAAP